MVNASRNPGIEMIKRSVTEKIEGYLASSGVVFTLKARIKSSDSILEKIARKNYGSEKKMQDLVGIRITCYFKDDIAIMKDFIESLYPDSQVNYDYPDSDVFGPARKNFVCQLDLNQTKLLTDVQESSVEYKMFDNTFELQLRSAFTDGWYEMDHALRYKNLGEWSGFDLENRLFNGFLATTETIDEAIINLFHSMAYQQYKSKNWQAMLRFKFRLNFVRKDLSDHLIEVFNENSELGKKFMKLERFNVVYRLVMCKWSHPTTLDGLVYFVNYFFINNQRLIDLTPRPMLQSLEVYGNGKLETEI